MLSRVKQVQLAAVAALAVMFTTNASLNPANAQKTGLQVAQVEKPDTKGTSSSDRGSGKAGNSGAGRTSGSDGMKGSSSNDRGMTSQRSTRSNDGDRSTRRTTVRSGNDTTVRTRSGGSRDYTNNRSSRDYSNNRSNRRVYYRGRSSTTVAFVVLGPRVVYRSYGSGWCRALHSGRHFAPRIGWHRGRHVGAVRCR